VPISQSIATGWSIPEHPLDLALKPEMVRVVALRESSDRWRELSKLRGKRDSIRVKV